MIFFKSSKKENAGQDAGQDAAHAEFKREALAHMAPLYRTALYMTRKPEAAQDLVQDTYLKAHRFWHRYQPGTNCKAWLFRIMTNTFINQNRRKARIFMEMDDTKFEVSRSPLHQKNRFYGNPDAQYMQELFPEHVQKAVESLPETFRIPVILADLQDFSYKEIAEMMDCPVGTVMSRLFRGRKKLQELLFEYAVEQGIIAQEDAKDDEGAISLDAYRDRKAARA